MERTLETSGDSVDDARNVLLRQMSPGDVVVEEIILFDGAQPRVRTGWSKREAEALREAKAAVPPGATIISEKIRKQAPAPSIYIHKTKEAAELRAISISKEWSTVRPKQRT